jgi:chromosome segregation ATPase
MSDETCCGACGYPIHATKESACDWCRQSADRIEALTAERDEHWKSFVHWRKEADVLTEQLEAARADAKEAEAYAEELERDLKTCRMAQGVMDNTVAELELKSEWFEEEWVSAVDKLNKAVKALQYYAVEAMSWDADDSLIARTALAEIEGSNAP